MKNAENSHRRRSQRERRSALCDQTAENWTGPDSESIDSNGNIDETDDRQAVDRKDFTPNGENSPIEVSSPKENDGPSDGRKQTIARLKNSIQVLQEQNLKLLLENSELKSVIEQKSAKLAKLLQTKTNSIRSNELRSNLFRTGKMNVSMVH